MTALGRRLAGLKGWRRYLLAAVLGAIAAGALPPLYLLPLLPVAFTGLVWLCDGSRGRVAAFAVGWCFGLGHFVAGLYWIGHAFLVDAERFGGMMPFAVAGLSAYLALFPGLAVLAAWLARPAGVGRIVALAAAWTVAEWLRGELLTGFPWNLVGYAWSVSESMLQLTWLTGILGLSLVTVLAAAMPAALSGGEPGAGRRWRPLALAGALLLVLWVGGQIRLLTAQVGEVPGVRLRLVQANIPQAEKWRPDRREANFARYLQLTSSPGAARVSHVIWPETAAAFFIAKDAPRRRLIGGLAPPGGLVLTGAPRTTAERTTPFRVWNSFHAIAPGGEIVATYDKFHPVPFGEYLPLRGLLERLGLDRLAQGAADFSSGPGPTTLELAGLPPVSPLICYEVIFPSRVTEPGRRPGWLLNLTNDAWFGSSSGPYQHLAMARVRAVEQGLPLVRSAGTGISAVVDPYGRVLGRLGLNKSGVLDAALPRALDGPSLYARLGDLPILVLALAALVAVRLRRGASAGAA
jgi:apolipoprotein N-acyltransferase